MSLSLLSRNQEKLFRTIWGQYSSTLQSKIKSLSEYHIRSSDLGAPWLLKELKKATSGIDAKADPRLTLIDSLYGIFCMKQGATESNDCYIERFKANMSTVELACGSNVFCCTELMNKVGAAPTNDILRKNATALRQYL